MEEFSKIDTLEKQHSKRVSESYKQSVLQLVLGIPVA